MARVTRQIKIHATADKVWEALADFGGIYRWNPGIVHSYSTSEQGRGTGATRRCDLPNDGYLEERIVDWQEGEHLDISVYDSSLPIARSAVRFAVRPDGDGSVVTASPDYQLKFGPVGTVIDMLFARRQTERGFDEMLHGLKRYVETGQEVERPEPAAAA